MKGPRRPARLQDTSDEAENVLVELTRQMPPWKRAQQLSRLILSQHVLILADLRRRHPTANAEELRKRKAARLLSRDDVIRIFNWDPEKEGY
jgi:hypothetical protein